MSHIKTQELEALPHVVVEVNTSNNTNRNCTKPQTSQTKISQTKTAQTEIAHELKVIHVVANGAFACLVLIAIPALVTIFNVYAYNAYENNDDDYDMDDRHEQLHCANTKYLVDLDIYLYVAVSAQLGMYIIFALTKVIALLFACCAKPWTKIKTLLYNQWGRIKLFYPLFPIVWACIGIYIYIQMNEDCRNEFIGLMILFWSVIPFFSVCCVMCCCWLFFLVASPEHDTNEIAIFK